MKLSLSFIQTALKKQGIDTILVCADGRRYERVVLLEYALLDGYSDDTLYVCDEGELAQVNESPGGCISDTPAAFSRKIPSSAYTPQLSAFLIRQTSFSYVNSLFLIQYIFRVSVRGLELFFMKPV